MSTPKPNEAQLERAREIQRDWISEWTDSLDDHIDPRLTRRIAAAIAEASAPPNLNAAAALRAFGNWYITLGRMNPEALVALKEIIPSNLLKQMAHADCALREAERRIRAGAPATAAEAERENAARVCEDLVTFTENHTTGGCGRIVV